MLGIHKIGSDIRGCVYQKPVQLLKTTLIATGPTQVTTTGGTWFRIARIIAIKDLNGTNNAGVVKIGWTSTASQLPIVMAAGTSIVYEAPVGAKHDLADLYVSVATDNDGIVVVYS